MQVHLQAPADVVHVENNPPAVQPPVANEQHLIPNDQPQKDEYLVANEQLPETEHPADEQLVTDVQPLATAAEPQISAETTILAEK